MSYEEKNESSEMQTVPTFLQNLLQIPPMGWILFIILALVVANVLPWWGGMVLVAGGWVLVSSIERRHAMEYRRAKAAGYVNCISPIIIDSTAPDEGLDSLNARAESWKQSLIDSGNPYARIIPIIIYPYQPVLTELGGLSMSWGKYRVSVGQKQHDENMKWYNTRCPHDLKAQFAADVLPAPKVDFSMNN